MAEKLISQLIKSYGQIPIDWFWQIANEHYYNRYVSIGRGGDFITAPEFSKKFSEIVAKKIAEQAKSIKQFNLIELGPGYGSLSLMILTYLENHNIQLPDQLVLIDKSKRLRAIQKKKLEKHSERLLFLNNIEEFSEKYYSPDKFNIFFANEFFDALPIKQWILKNNTLQEIMISIKDDNLIYSLGVPISSNLDSISHLNTGDILEKSPYTEEVIRNICQCIKGGKGYFLMIDYGYIVPPYKSTIATIYKNKKTSFLKHIGQSDISAFVNFSNIKNILSLSNITSTLSTQRVFLKKNGIIGSEAKNNMLLDKKFMGKTFKALETCA